MAIDIEKRFSVTAPLDRVWAFLIDPHQVAECLPGASITGKDDDRTYLGAMKVRVGPVSSSYEGRLRFESLDPETHTAELTASGQDVRGRGGADMTMRSQLTEGASGTEVVVTSSVSVTGILAQMGRGMIQDVGDQLFEQFTNAMRARLEGEDPATPSGDSAGAAAGALADAAAPVGGTPPPRPATPTVPSERAEALDLAQLGAAVGRRRLARALRNPIVWIVAVIVAGVVTFALLP